MKTKLIASAKNLESLSKLAGEYFFSPCIHFENSGQILNFKGQVIEGYVWIKKGGRFRLEKIES